MNTSASLFVGNGMILKKAKSGWIRPSQAKQLELLEKWHGITIADRTLRYHHLNHTRAGLTHRRRQWDRRDDGTCFRETTKMCYTVAGYQLLVSFGHSWAKDKIRWLIQKYGAKSDSAKIPPGGAPDTAPEQPPKEPGKTPFEDPDFRQRRGLEPIPSWKKKTS